MSITILIRGVKWRGHWGILGRMRAMLPLLGTVVAVGLGWAADPPRMPVDSSFLKRYAETRGFLLGRPTRPKVSPDGKFVYFLRADPPSTRQKLFAFEVGSRKTTEILSPETILGRGDEQLSPEEKARRERQRVSAGGFADYLLDPSGRRILVTLSGRLHIYDTVDRSVRTLKTSEGVLIDPKWLPDGSAISYVRGHDVAVYDLATDRETMVTTGGTSVVTHGLAEFVAQEEMGRHSGYWWSPDSKFLAYEEADHTGVEVWHIADPARPGSAPQPQYYPRPGKANVNVRLGIVPRAGGPTTWVTWDHKRYEYLAVVRWEENGPLTIQLQDRAQRELALFEVNPTTGATTLLLTEKDPAWVNIVPDSPWWSRKANGFYWVGEGSAGLEIQLRDRSGKLSDVPVPATQKPLDLVGLVTLIGENRVVYHTAPDSTQKQVRVTSPEPRPVKPGSEQAEWLTREPGLHTAVLGHHGTTAAITSTTLTRMPYVQVRSIVGQDLGELPSTAEEPTLRPNVSIQKLGDYWTAVVRPRNVAPGLRIPVIVDVYGGPRHLHVVQAQRNWLVPQWLADQGFIVVAIENRGTPAQGRDWERAVAGKFGTVPLEDQARGLKLLGEKFPELDLTRVGVIGWSFGGYLSANAVLRRPDVFHAAVAGAPVTDWTDYDTHYTERYLGTLPENLSAYDSASLLPLAAGLSRPLLLVHGTADDNVYYRHSLRLADAAFRSGKPVELLALPGVTHMVSADPVAFERYYVRTAQFFQTHLGRPQP